MFRGLKMVLFSFSISEHIKKIKSGIKAQTTRIPRKPRKNGAPAYQVGDKVQLYYKSRQKSTCDNCITTPQPKPCNFFHTEMSECQHHTNFFGESEIIKIIHYHYSAYKENGNEMWNGIILGGLPEEEKESWAKADGFDSWLHASLYFFRSTNDPMWMYRNLDVIVWEKENIIERWQK